MLQQAATRGGFLHETSLMSVPPLVLIVLVDERRSCEGASRSELGGRVGRL